MAIGLSLVVSVIHPHPTPKAEENNVLKSSVISCILVFLLPALNLLFGWVVYLCIR